MLTERNGRLEAHRYVEGAEDRTEVVDTVALPDGNGAVEAQQPIILGR